MMENPCNSTMHSTKFNVKGFHTISILCCWEFVACISFPLSFPWTLVRGNLWTPNLYKKKMLERLLRKGFCEDINNLKWKRKKPSNKGSSCNFLLNKMIIKFNVFEACMKKLDLLSYEVHLNYHISVGEVLGVVCQYSFREKWATLFLQHLKQENNTQLLHLT